MTGEEDGTGMLSEEQLRELLDVSREWTITSVEVAMLVDDIRDLRRRQNTVDADMAALRDVIAEQATAVRHLREALAGLLAREPEPCAFDHRGSCHTHRTTGACPCSRAWVAWAWRSQWGDTPPLPVETSSRRPSRETNTGPWSGAAGRPEPPPGRRRQEHHPRLAPLPQTVTCPASSRGWRSRHRRAQAALTRSPPAYKRRRSARLRASGSRSINRSTASRSRIRSAAVVPGRPRTSRTASPWPSRPSFTTPADRTGIRHALSLWPVLRRIVASGRPRPRERLRRAVLGAEQ
jgi:hypothetical protein